jgi:hypothetical protein
MATGITTGAAATPDIGQLQQLLASVQAQAQALGVAGGGAVAPAVPGVAAAAPAAGNGITGAPDRPSGQIQGTGQYVEAPDGTGKSRYYGPDGREITAVQFELSRSVQVPFENNGIAASGLTNLSRALQAKQEQLKRLMDAQAKDANNFSQLNQGDVQQITMQNNVMTTLATLQNKFYETLTQAVQVWLR